MNTEPDDRVMRGGSWIDRARGTRSGYRDGYYPDGRREVNGFRLILRKNHVVRGGSWSNFQDSARASCRLRYSPCGCFSDFGLRLILRRCYGHKQ